MTMTQQAAEKIANLASVSRNEPNIGKLLVEAGKIEATDSERIHKLQTEENLRFGEAAIKLGLVTQDDIKQALASQYKYAVLSPGETDISPELLAAYRPFTPEVESLRALRTQLKLRWLNQTRKHLALISPRAGSGCTFHAANLAVVFAQLGERTLLIDGNLREPRQHLIFGQGNREGLTEVLGGRVDYAPLVHLAKLGGLSILPAGAIPPNPAELLSRGTFQALLDQLDSYFDVILIDTSPAALSTDAQAIAAACGGALLVARQNKTRLNELAAIKETLELSGTDIAGVVLNKY